MWQSYDGPPDTAIVNRSVGYAYSNNVYYIGGVSADTVRADVWSINVPMNVWYKMADFPVKQYGGVAVVIDKTAYAGMGRGPDNVCNDSLWMSEDGALSWIYKTTYPITGSVLGSVVCNNLLYIVDEDHNIIAYNPEKDIWTKKSRIIGGRRAFHCIYSVGNKIYIGLGNDESIMVYDPSWDN